MFWCMLMPSARPDWALDLFGVGVSRRPFAQKKSLFFNELNNSRMKGPRKRTRSRGETSFGRPSHSHLRQIQFLRLPSGCAILPLIIRQLFHVGPVIAHHKDLAVRLR